MDIKCQECLKAAFGMSNAKPTTGTFLDTCDETTVETPKLTFNQVMQRLGQRPCTVRRCALIKSDGNTWKNIGISIAGLHWRSRWGSITSHINNVFNFLITESKIKDNSRETVINLFSRYRCMYPSHSAERKSRFVIKGLIAAVPIICPNCGSDVAPIPVGAYDNHLKRCG